MSFKDLARVEPVRKRLHPRAVAIIESGQFPYQTVGQYLDAEVTAAETLSRIRVSGVAIFDEITLHDLLWAICYLSAHSTDEVSPKAGFSPATTREKLENENYASNRFSHDRPESAMVAGAPAHNIASTKKRMNGDAAQESASIIQDPSLLIAELVDRFQADIAIEKTEIQRVTGKKYSLVTHYQLTQKAGAFYFYSIWISDELRLQEEDSVILVSAKQRINAHLINTIDSQNFSVRTSEQLTQDVYRLRRAFDPAFILVALSETLSHVKERTSEVASLVATKLVGNPHLSLADVSHWPISLNTSQVAAIKAAESWRVSFIWGPPGTGKTFTLGHVIYRAHLRSETVLVLSTSNVAVDQALLSLDRILSKKSPGILRLGHTENEICRGYENDARLVKTSTVVFSTLASAVLNFDELLESRFDLVIVDEASMVSLPYIFSAAHLAQLRIVIAGDFCQLQPISLAQTTLSESIYHYFGMHSNIHNEDLPPYLILLETQYRMTSSLSGLVSRLFYGGRLRCGRREPEEKHSLFFINTDSDDRYNFSFYSVALESYYNPLTLAVLESLISRSKDPSISVLVITPFRAQQVLVGQFMASDINSRSRCLTVHRAQGTEADIVVFDLTAHAKTTISGYPRILESNGVENLLDVALSRARDKLYILGSLSMIAALAEKMGIWNQLHDEIRERFVMSASSLAYSILPDFDRSLLDRRTPDPEVIVAVDPAGEKEFFHEFVNSNAPRKYYFLPEHRIPSTSEETRQITFRGIRRNKFPPMTIWGSKIALWVKSGHRFIDSRLGAAILRRIALGHIIDLQEPDPSDTLIISCDKCGGNRDLVYDSLTGCYFLQCERCRRRIHISRDIGSRIAQIYDVKCPICGSEMLPRKKSTDNSYSFFGCSNYPRCNGIASFRKFSRIAK